MNLPQGMVHNVFAPVSHLYRSNVFAPISHLYRTYIADEAARGSWGDAPVSSVVHNACPKP